MIPNFIGIVFATKWRPLSCDWNGALKSALVSANRVKLNDDKTELLWAGSKYSQPSLGSKGLPLQIDSDTVTASDHVRVLGVTVSADLSLINYNGR